MKEGKKRQVRTPDTAGRKLRKKVRAQLGVINRMRFPELVDIGTCSFCGQRAMIGKMLPPKEADRTAWRHCGCDGAKNEREKEDQYDAAREWVMDEFGGESAMTDLLLDSIEAVRIRYGGLYADSIKVVVGNTSYGVKYSDERGVLVKKTTKHETENAF